MGNLFQDVRFGLRMLARSPGFSLVVVCSLALGIGVNSTIFGLVNAVFLRPPPAVRDADRLVWVFQSRLEGERSQMSLSYPDYLDVRGREAFSGVLAYGNTGVLLAGPGGEGELVDSQLVSGDYFSVLGVTPALGRSITPADDRAGADGAVVVLGYELWQRRFGGDPSLIGKTVSIDKQSFTVIGVAPPGFIGPELVPRAEAWMPIAVRAALAPSTAGRDLLHDRHVHQLTVVGRLAPGTGVDGVRASLDALSSQLASAYPETNRELMFRVDRLEGGLQPGDRSDAMPVAVLLFAVVGLVLLIACVNVGSLLLARSGTRRREIAIRRALGAGRGRLVRQLLTESLMLALAGGVVALLLAVWAGDLLAAAIADFALVPMALDVAPDGRMLLFTFAVSIVSGVAFGLAPALHASRRDPAPTLAAETTTASASARRSRLRSAFVVAQIALSLLMLVGSGLFLRSLASARDVDPGFDAGAAWTVPVSADGLQLEEARGQALYRRLVERIEAVPGVRAASLAQVLPLGRQAMIWGVGIHGRPSASEPGAEVAADVVAPRYFAAMGIPLLRGRDFARDEAAPVAIVNETFARRFFGGEAVGQSIWGGGQHMEIVGVVRDSKMRMLGEEPSPVLYVPLAQSYSGRVHMVVGVTPGAPPPAQAIRQAIAEVDSGLPVAGLQPLARIVDTSLFPARIGALLLGSFGVLALLLAVIGIYGVLAFSVRMRTREIGIRIALGAARRDVLRLVIGEGMVLVLAGLAIGVALAIGVTRLLAGFLYGVSPTDPVTFAGVLALLGGAALLASWLPARFASRVDPMVALRNDDAG